ncbi:hypothetical protein [Candidatus Uabimicrobium sp. HlEnr_7]|uniref:hypothetical protein n=1 Tax=Candidatus Uabimicrobium helgolandensis TaxID=3095367 RepID=UPI003557656F
MKKILIRASIVIYLLFTLMAVCAAGYFALKSTVWFRSGYSRQDSCFKTLRYLNSIIAVYQADFHIPPTSFNSLLAIGLLGNTDGEIYHCLSCSVVKGSQYGQSNIFGEKLPGHSFDRPPQIDYCYLYHKSLPITNSTILAYCPNQHNNKIPTIFGDGNVDYVPINDFQKQFNLQAKLLEKAQVKFSFKRGIIFPKK